MWVLVWPDRVRWWPRVTGSVGALNTNTPDFYGTRLGAVTKSPALTVYAREINRRFGTPAQNVTDTMLGTVTRASVFYWGKGTDQTPTAGTISVSAGTSQVSVGGFVVPGDPVYAAVVEPSWVSGYGISGKTPTGFLVTFDTPAPDQGGTVDWFVAVFVVPPQSTTKLGRGWPAKFHVPFMGWSDRDGVPPVSVVADLQGWIARGYGVARYRRVIGWSDRDGTPIVVVPDLAGWVARGTPLARYRPVVGWSDADAQFVTDLAGWIARGLPLKPYLRAVGWSDHDAAVFEGSIAGWVARGMPLRPLLRAYGAIADLPLVGASFETAAGYVARGLGLTRYLRPGVTGTSAQDTSTPAPPASQALYIPVWRRRRR